MFLRPSPPRLTRRSRVDNWLLLLLRGLILLLIALAFGRIFFRQTDFLNISDLPTRRVAILVDTSASMLRDGIWEQVKEKYQEVIGDLGPKDDVGVYSYDKRLKSLVSFSSGESENAAAKQQLIRDALQSVQPGYAATDLGQALIDAVDELQGDQESDSKDQISESQIILISDLQAGSQIRSLQSFEWPAKIPIDIVTVGAQPSSNAYLSLLDNSQGLAADSRLRVKVSNVEDSQASEFELNWLSEEGDESELAATVIVPPGQSRVVNLLAPDFAFTGLKLNGDSDSFDNRLYPGVSQAVAGTDFVCGGRRRRA